MAAGDTPNVTRAAMNHGIVDVIPHQGLEPNPGGAITVGLDTQTVFFQPAAFYTSQNIQELRSDHPCRETAMVLLPIIRRQVAKFSWGGNGATLGRLRRPKLVVPITPEGGIDWDGMRRSGRWLLRRAALSAHPMLLAGATLSVTDLPVSE